MNTKAAMMNESLFLFEDISLQSLNFQLELPVRFSGQSASSCAANSVLGDDVLHAE
jgi:hypothetical protein